MSHESAQMRPLVSSERRGQHPWREILHRARDPRLVADTALRTLMQAWNLVSPSDFAVLYRQVRTETMCSVARLRGLHRALGYVVMRGIAGDVVECGCARGESVVGTSAMRNRSSVAFTTISVANSMPVVRSPIRSYASLRNPRRPQ